MIVKCFNGKDQLEGDFIRKKNYLEGVEKRKYFRGK